jgi:hypothetical protein
LSLTATGIPDPPSEILGKKSWAAGWHVVCSGGRLDANFSTIL